MSSEICVPAIISYMENKNRFTPLVSKCSNGPQTKSGPLVKIVPRYSQKSVYLYDLRINFYIIFHGMLKTMQVYFFKRVASKPTGFSHMNRREFLNNVWTIICNSAHTRNLQVAVLHCVEMFSSEELLQSEIWVEHRGHRTCKMYAVFFTANQEERMRLLDCRFCVYMNIANISTHPQYWTRWKEMNEQLVPACTLLYSHNGTLTHLQVFLVGSRQGNLHKKPGEQMLLCVLTHSPCLEKFRGAVHECKLIYTHTHILPHAITKPTPKSDWKW